MGFLVQVDPLTLLEEHRVHLAEQSGRVVAFLSAAPIFARPGWLLQNLIRAPDAPNGTAELLVDHAMRSAEAEAQGRRLTDGDPRAGAARRTGGPGAPPRALGRLGAVRLRRAPRVQGPPPAHAVAAHSPRLPAGSGRRPHRPRRARGVRPRASLRLRTPEPSPWPDHRRPPPRRDARAVDGAPRGDGRLALPGAVGALGVGDLRRGARRSAVPAGRALERPPLTLGGRGRRRRRGGHARGGPRSGTSRGSGG